jgi:hypothetical protein
MKRQKRRKDTKVIRIKIKSKDLIKMIRASPLMRRLQLAVGGLIIMVAAMSNFLAWNLLPNPASNSLNHQAAAPTFFIHMENNPNLRKPSNMLHTSPQPQPRRPIRFLWGILTQDSPKEKLRRQCLRETYLSFYKNNHDGSPNNNPNRICSLQEMLLHEKMSTRLEKVMSIPLENSLQECEVIYTFVLGSNPHGPTELLHFNSSFPLTLSFDESASSNNSINNLLPDENDISHLNIKENMNEGKTTTWFRYASIVANQMKMEIDFIAKVDTDSVLAPPRFLDEFVVHSNLLLSNKQGEAENNYVYGGIAVNQNRCSQLDLEAHPHCKQMVGELYMSGELYFMSTQLARHITSSSFEKIAHTHHEDLTTGNLVFGSVDLAFEKVKLVFPQKERYYWRHRLRSPEQVHDWYQGFLNDWKNTTSTTAITTSP